MESDEYDSSSNSRRNSLSISALLNDDSIDPILPSSRPLTPEEKRENRKTWPGFVTEEVPKPKRKRTSTQQFNRLMAVYQQTDTPSSEVREQLAEELDMTKREVQVWFQNRRAKASRARATAIALANSNQSTISSLSQYYHQQPPPIWADSNNLGYATTRGSSIYGSHTPPRRASISQSDPSSQLLLNRHPPPPTPLSLQPIAPMPPYNSATSPSTSTTNTNSNNNNNNGNNNTNNNTPIGSPHIPVPPPTPPFVKPIIPRHHNLQQGFQNLSLQGSVPDHHVKKRPKSAIDLYTSFDFTRPPP